MTRVVIVDARLWSIPPATSTHDMRIQKATPIGMKMRRLQRRYARWAKNVCVKLIVTAAVSCELVQSHSR